MTCTFTNDLAPPPVGDITLSKQVVVAPGSLMPTDSLPQAFSYTLSGPSSTSATASLTVPWIVPSRPARPSPARDGQLDHPTRIRWSLAGRVDLDADGVEL